MPYITRKGTVEPKRPGFFASILGLFTAIIDFFTMFFATMFSPDAHAAAKRKQLDSAKSKGGPGGGPGGSGGRGPGPRIVGLDKLGGGGGAAACPTSG